MRVGILLSTVWQVPTSSFDAAGLSVPGHNDRDWARIKQKSHITWTEAHSLGQRRTDSKPALDGPADTSVITTALLLTRV